MMLKTFPLLLLIVLAWACNGVGNGNRIAEAVKLKNSSSGADYKPFLEKFLTDSVTQLSSIHFPLKSVIQEDNGDVVNFIERKDWEYQNFRKRDYIISDKRVDDSEFEMTVQIADTGVHVIYSFEYENGKWILSLIEDSST